MNLHLWSGVVEEGIRMHGQSQHHGSKGIPEWVMVAGFTPSYGFSI